MSEKFHALKLELEGKDRFPVGVFKDLASEIDSEAEALELLNLLIARYGIGGMVNTIGWSLDTAEPPIHAMELVVLALRVVLQGVQDKPAGDVVQFNQDTTGDSIDRVADWMVALAKSNGCVVEHEFNQKIIWAGPTDKPNDVVMRYNAAGLVPGLEHCIARRKRERVERAAPDLLSIAKRWAALWDVTSLAREKAELLADTRAAIAKATGAE